MSADNWLRCPRCTAKGLAKLAARDAEIQASYGVVPVEEFDEARRSLAADRTAFQERRPTFREDYEFYGAEDGTVTASYSGWCSECDLRLKFEDRHPIPGLDPS